MRVNAETLDLIKQHEGFRAKAYRDPVGVWTIGYGHTSAAGEPQVREGMEVTRAEAERILARDVSAFADGVRRLLTRDLNDRRFGALVSFAYNVGLENFAGSSVLKAVNQGDWKAVGRRLQLWVKAGGDVLPGLVKRRAAEAAAFADGDDAGPAGGLISVIEMITGKSLFGSTTNLAALIAALTGTTTALQASFKEISALTGGGPTSLVLMAVMLGASGWIVFQRHLKSAEDGV
jgi:lysozyme